MIKDLISKYNLIGVEIKYLNDFLKASINPLSDNEIEIAVKNAKEKNAIVTPILKELKRNKIPKTIKNIINENLIFTDDIKEKLHLAFKKYTESQDDSRYFLSEKLLSKLKWREDVLKNIKNQNGGTLICSNPTSDFNIRRIPLDIGGMNMDDLKYNDKNPFLATIDHIFPKGKFPELAFDEDNIQVLSKNANFSKNEFIIDFRKIQINQFINKAKNSQKIIDNWELLLNSIHQLSNFKIYKATIDIDEDDNFIIFGNSKFGTVLTDEYNLRWDISGKSLDNGKNLKLDYSYLKRFKAENKMDIIKKLWL
jgi:hypothetical protein